MRYSSNSNVRIYQRISKNVFHWEKLYFEYTGNSGRILALGKALDIDIDYLMFYPSRKHAKWKQFKYKLTLNNSFRHMASWWTAAKINVFSVIRNNFVQAFICWWVTLFVRIRYWGQVVEMNFSSIFFDKFLKIVFFLPDESYIRKNTMMRMMFHHTGIYFQEENIWNIYENSSKYKNLEEEFNYSSSEAATRCVL